MLARVARYEINPERCDEAVDAFMESAQSIAGMDGLERGYVLVDSENGGVMTITFWRDDNTAEASAVAATRARRRAVEAVDGDVLSVQSFDVVRDFGDSSGS